MRYPSDFLGQCCLFYEDGICWRFLYASLFPLFYPFMPLGQFIIHGVVFWFGFCSPLVMSPLNQDDKINFGCMKSCFRSFIQDGLALYNVSETSSAWPPQTFLMSCALIPNVVYALIISVSLPSTISFSLLISLFYLFLPSSLVIINPFLSSGK